MGRQNDVLFLLLIIAVVGGFPETLAHLLKVNQGGKYHLFAPYLQCSVQQDTVIFERLQEKQMYMDSTVEHLEDFAKEGKST